MQVTSTGPRVTKILASIVSWTIARGQSWGVKKDLATLTWSIRTGAATLRVDTTTRTTGDQDIAGPPPLMMCMICAMMKAGATS